MELPTLVACVLGLTLDLIFGDPRKMPHLVKLTGRLVTQLEAFWSQVIGRTILSGCVLWLSLNVAMLGSYLVIRCFLNAVHPWLTVPIDTIVIFQSIAFTDLTKHVAAVSSALKVSITKARERVSWIVGRDTNQMDESAVCRAAIESGAENYNDAAIAPLFWLILLGPIGALFFRICNTLDAMVGHRNERFEKIGKCSARMDDILNFVPARICAFILCKPLNWPTFRSLKPDAIKHPSWNAGWPEAAMAKRLGIVIGGEMYLHGQLIQTDEMNEGGRQPTAHDIDRSVSILRHTYKWSLVVTFSILFLGYIIS